MNQEVQKYIEREENNLGMYGIGGIKFYAIFIVGA